MELAIEEGVVDSEWLSLGGGAAVTLVPQLYVTVQLAIIAHKTIYRDKEHIIQSYESIN